MKKSLDKENFDVDTGKPIEIDSQDTKQLVQKTIIHKECGKKHIDEGKFATFNHRKHLCHNCDAYFYDTERAIGVE